jgi:hypothetical protein
MSHYEDTFVIFCVPQFCLKPLELAAGVSLVCLGLVVVVQVGVQHDEGLSDVFLELSII